MQKLDSLIPISPELIVPASVTCAEAFMDDPYTHYVIPDPRKRSNLRYGFEYYIRMSILGAAMPYTTSDRCEGIAIWQDSREQDPPGLLFRINPLLPFRCGWRYVIREFKLNRIAEKIKKKYAPQPHMYLALLSVKPVNQGQGYAGKLLRPMLEQLDSKSLPCYLETQNLRNVSLYEHFGFKVVYNTFISEAGFSYYIMIRG